MQLLRNRNRLNMVRGQEFRIAFDTQILVRCCEDYRYVLELNVAIYDLRYSANYICSRTLIGCCSKRSLFTRAFQKDSRTRPSSSNERCSLWLNTFGTLWVVPIPAGCVSFRKVRSLENFRAMRERELRNWKSQFIIQRIGKCMILNVFVHYRFPGRFQNKTEPLKRKVQFMISMHSECYNLSQSFVLLCFVLSCSNPVLSALSRHVVFSIICSLSTSIIAVIASVTIGCLCVCVWRSCRCSWANRRSETTKVAPVSQCFVCLRKIENRLRLNMAIGRHPKTAQTWFLSSFDVNLSLLAKVMAFVVGFVRRHTLAWVTFGWGLGVWQVKGRDSASHLEASFCDTLRANYLGASFCDALRG